MPASGEVVPGLAELLRGPVEDVAARLLGAELRHGGVAVRITEVEAYAGAGDPASHAHRGATDRNRVMFGPAGRLYCYLSHGIHVCANVSAGADGEPAAVLLRAGVVVDGLPLARRRRGAAVTDRDLARGPGRLCQALGIGLGDDGADLARGTPRLSVTDGTDPADPIAAQRVRTGPRVGVRRAAERPWRYWIDGATVSDDRRHPRAEPGW